ncbi:peptide chain release factor subunit 3 [Pancytospora epiphaga]|nr:peptide chain release factor subunit 3 [Pancytospora epiphaga]
MELNLEKLSIRPSRIINIIFVGHVDAGKSTICGRILVDLGKIDSRTLEKYKQQSTDMNRASWYLSWCMDLNPEEREKGKTTEVGSASFDLSRTRINILDAPGHKQYVREMIDGASRADVGVLIVSARINEFEAGFKKGQTKEHLLLLKSGNVDRVVVLVNKMDECGWCAERYNEIVGRVEKYAKKMFGELFFIPVCGYTGENIKERYATPLYDGPSFLEYLDTVEVEEHSGSPCMTIVEKVKTSGSVYFYAKVESGTFSKVAESYKILPGGMKDRIVSIQTEDDVEVATTVVGETYKIKFKDCSEEVMVGMRVVGVDNDEFVACSEMYAQVGILEVNNAVTPGYDAILHSGQQAVPCQIVEIYTMEKKRVRVARKGEKVIARIRLELPIIVSNGKNKERSSRFSLRDESMTIASGVVKKVIE